MPLSHVSFFLSFTLSIYFPDSLPYLSCRDISKLYPHNPEMWALAVKGLALETQLEDLALAPIDLSEVEQQLAGTDLTSYEAYMVGGAPFPFGFQICIWGFLYAWDL